jgi:hypothetical protein
MKMKEFRIKENGGYFTPQWRFSFWTWKYFRKYDISGTYEIVDFQTLDEAEEFLSMKTEVLHYPKKQSNCSFSFFNTGTNIQQNNNKCIRK